MLVKFGLIFLFERPFHVQALDLNRRILTARFWYFPGQSIRTVWHWDKVLPEYFAVPLSVSFQQYFIMILILIIFVSERQAG